MDFPTAKLLDYAKDLDALENDPNPFAAIVVAHLQTQATRNQPEEGYLWTMRLFKGLLDRGLKVDEIRRLLRLIDWRRHQKVVVLQETRECPPRSGQPVAAGAFSLLPTPAGRGPA